MDESEKKSIKNLLYVLFLVWYFMGIVLYALTNSLVCIFVGVVGSVCVALGIEALSPMAST